MLKYVLEWLVDLVVRFESAYSEFATYFAISSNLLMFLSLINHVDSPLLSFMSAADTQ